MKKVYIEDLFIYVFIFPTLVLAKFLNVKDLSELFVCIRLTMYIFPCLIPVIWDKQVMIKFPFLCELDVSQPNVFWIWIPFY